LTFKESMVWFFHRPYFCNER